MSGLTPLIDTLLATRLAQRVDLVPLKSELEIVGTEAVTHVEKVTNDVRLPSRLALQQQLGVGLLRSDQRGHGNAPARPGETVSLSVAARALTAILDVQAGAAAKIIGTEPLLSQSQLQPALPQVLAATLARTVANSGLFYESHLAQYAAGTRTLAQLAQEPQARLDAMVRTSSVVLSAGAAVPDPVAGTVANAREVEAARLPVAAAALAVSAEAGEAVSGGSGKAGATPSPSPLPAALAAGPEQAYSLAGSERTSLREYEHAAIADPAEPDVSGKIHGAGTSDSARSSAPGLAGIHPEAITLVRQQLELLAAPVFRWGGEGWPGMSMDWEIREERGEPQEQEDGRGDDGVLPAASTWTTRITMQLPRLGAVDLRLSLADTALRLHLVASEKATVALLDAGRDVLPQRFDALGLQLTELQIGALAEDTAASDTPGQGDAA